MDKLLGILPYIYFEEPVRLGNVTFLSLPDWQGRVHAPAADSDKLHLRELSDCFAVTRGLSTDKGGVRAMTYVLLEIEARSEAQTLRQAHKAVSLLRYAMLRPDSQALDNIESTYIYAFALPPGGSGDYRLYRCWPNLNVEQETWVSLEHQWFPLPGWHVDFQLMHTSQLEDVDAMNQRVCGQGRLDREDEVILAIDWYNQSFLRYAIGNIARRLVDMSIAFETLFQLQKERITLREAVTQTLGATRGSPVEHWAGAFYGCVRSATTHSGKPSSLLYKHPRAKTPHLGFLWSSQRVFRECVSAKLGLPRHIDNDRLIDELIPNEVHLRKLKEAGSFQRIVEDGLLGEVEKLRLVHPAGSREDIIWLGNELLRGYKNQCMPNQQALPTLQLILDCEDTGPDLGLQYYHFLEEFRPIYPEGYIAAGRDEVSEEAPRNLKRIARGNMRQFQLEGAIYGFARFAGWALLLPP